MNFNDLVLSIEEHIPETYVQPIEQAEGAAIQTEVIEETSQLEDEVEHIDKIDKASTDAEQAIESIDEVVEVIDDEDAPATLTPTEEKVVEVSLESIYSKLGMDQSKATLESFGRKSNRKSVVATLEEKSEGIFKKLLNAIKAAGSYVLEFIQNLFRNSWILSKYCASVRNKVKKIGNSEEPSKKEMEDSAKAMSIDGDASGASLDPMFKTAMDLINLSEKLVEKVNTLNFKFKGDADEDFEKDDFLVKGGNIVSRGKGYAGFLTGDRAITEIAWETELLRATYNTAPWTPKIAGKAVVLTPRQMNQAVDMADKIIAALKKMESKQSKIKNLVSRIIQGVAEIGTVYGSAVSKEARNKMKAMARIRNFRSFLNKGLSKYPLEAFKIAKAFIDYANNSSKLYKGGSAYKEDDPDGDDLTTRLDKGHNDDDVRVKKDLFEGDTSKREQSQKDRWGNRKFRNSNSDVSDV